MLLLLTALMRQFTYHIFYPFEVYKSMIFSIFTEPCNCHHNQLQTFLSPQKEASYSLAMTR